MPFFPRPAFALEGAGGHRSALADRAPLETVVREALARLAEQRRDGPRGLLPGDVWPAPALRAGAGYEDEDRPV